MVTRGPGTAMPGFGPQGHEWNTYQPPFAEQFRRHGQEVPPGLPRSLYNQRTVAQGRSIVNRLGLGSLSVPSQRRGGRLRQMMPMFNAMYRNYGQRVEESFRNFMSTIDAQSLEQELYNLQFDPTVLSALKDIVHHLQHPYRKVGGRKPLIWMHRGMQSIWLGKVHEYQNAVQQASTIASTPAQQAYLSKLNGTLQQLIAMDPHTESRYQHSHKKSFLGKYIKRFGRITGLFATSGLALMSGLVDYNNRSLTFPTILYLGSTALLANPGALDSKLTKHVRQLRGLTGNRYLDLQRRYNIQGRGWGEVADNFRNSGTQRTLRQYSRALRRGGKKGQAEAQKLRSRLLDSVAPNRSSGAQQTVRSMNDHELFALGNVFGNAHTRDAANSLRDYIQHGAGPSSLSGLRV